MHGALFGLAVAFLPLGVGDGGDFDDAKAEVNETLQKIAADVDALTDQAKQVQRELDALLLTVPNIPADDVPNGKSEEDNVEVSRWGEPVLLSFPAKDHVELGEDFSLKLLVGGALTVAGVLLIAMRQNKEMPEAALGLKMGDPS